MRRSDGDHLSWFQRLGITLVILGMMQSLAPACFTPNLLWLPSARSFDPSESSRDQESDQRPQDLEDLAEAFAWPEGFTERRSVERRAASATHCSLDEPEAAVRRTAFALQQSRALLARAANSSSTMTRLCRFLC